MERMWVVRLRWRMRGAWLWPSFVALTLVEGVVILLLPPWGEGPESVVGGMLLAGFANLAIVAVVAPMVGRRVRARRPDLPRMVADNYAGTALLLVIGVGFVVAGLVHRPAATEADADLAAAVRSGQAFARERGATGGADVVRLKEDTFRACVPAAEGRRRWICAFVDTSQSPPGVTADPDRTSNAGYRGPGGFR